MSMPAEQIKVPPLEQVKQHVKKEVNIEAMYEDLLRRKKLVRNNQLVIFLIIFALIAWSWYETGFKLSFLYSGTANIATFIFEDLLPPDFSSIAVFIKPAIDTVLMSYVGMLFSVVVSLVFGFLAAKNLTFHPVVGVMSRSVIAFLRAVPALVWGILMVAAFGLGPFAGTVALGLSGVGILAKAYADILEELDPGQIEAVRSTGASWFQIVGQGVWPQFKAGFVGWSLYKMDLNIREAAVLGLIGAGGIGTVLQSSISLFQYQRAAVGILIIWLLILLVEFTTAKVRERIL
ncbi:phosphonate ABC transporter permease protein PhnE [Halalkalibacter wakoensis JCM 9140]|uniref:Phosphonate ABC transporter permease protein PhnE n=1 Tax=Halalkalibacter wakoensis JCM 9140 TaxID=1236970 RepID=W4Q518_9BACI|nr:phosphonate ABC transporter, permease protein PhnE [Halalkalibacter wakoensis]GAE26429.1 phosphonate ABC transporter permease protein PhnE [Halalkalibacter wakoensis JCM 9140]